jgi:formate-dependent nitrite reductase membrane component NrfD
MDKTQNKKFAEVWGDTVILKELFLASIIGIGFTMAFFKIGSQYFASREGLDPQLAQGYSLMIGIAGCIVAAFISSKLFKPKRIIAASMDKSNIIAVLKEEGCNMEEEIEAFKQAKGQELEEMKELGFDILLDTNKEE